MGQVSEEQLAVIDARGRTVGWAGRQTVHRLGLRHQAVHIFVVDSQERLYLQQRQLTKDQYPGHWDSAAAGHLAPGEDYEAAARRELAEELGLEGPLELVAEVPASAATGWEQVRLYEHRTSQEPQPDPVEILQGRFLSQAELERRLADPAFPVTPAFRLLYQLWCQWRLEKNAAAPTSAD